MKMYVRSNVVDDAVKVSSLSVGDTFIESGDRYTAKSIKRGRNGEYVIETESGTVTLEPSDSVKIISRRSVKASQDPREATNFLLQCIDDGIIDSDTVVNEFCKYCSDDDVRSIAETLGLYDSIEVQ